jgi:hypothetical protein
MVDIHPDLFGGFSSLSPKKEAREVKRTDFPVVHTVSPKTTSENQPAFHQGLLEPLRKALSSMAVTVISCAIEGIKSGIFKFFQVCTFTVLLTLLAVLGLAVGAIVYVWFWLLASEPLPPSPTSKQPEITIPNFKTTVARNKPK